jgi:hypothetical protein
MGATAADKATSGRQVRSTEASAYRSHDGAFLHLCRCFARGSRAKRKEEALNGLPPRRRGQNSSLSLLGTVSMTRSIMAFGRAP